AGPPSGVGLGVRWMAQLRPFHRSAGVRTPAGPPPTATQNEADVHDTPPKPLPGAGLGVRWMAQLLPFHRSARVATGFPALSKGKPTATQNEADVHDTPVKPAIVLPTGLGVAWIVQSSPFHRSARVPAFDARTAAEAVSETQDSAFRFAPGRVGMCCRCQLRPFHRRASVDTTPRVGPTVPTATHALVAGQAIPFSWFSAAPTGLGTACRFQRPSRHRSPSVTGVPSPLPWPTAVQSDAEGQDTPLRKLALARAGWGAGGPSQPAPSPRPPGGTNAPELSTSPPTASQEETAHETLIRKACCAPARAGTDCTLQPVPFHRSA